MGSSIDDVQDSVETNTNMLQEVGARLDKVEESLREVKTDMEEAKKNMDKEMNQPYSIPGWKFIGRGTFRSSTVAISGSPISFLECVQMCEKERDEDFAWNGML